MTDFDITTSTMRDAYDNLYDQTELKKHTIKRDRRSLEIFEQYTGNPPIAEISNVHLQKLKSGMLEAGYSPATVNLTLEFLRKIFRVLQPQRLGCPQGLGLIERFPYVKPCKVPRKQPRRVPLDDLSRAFEAASAATKPRKYLNPADWWRAWISLIYFSGFRRCDMLSLMPEIFDFEAGTVDFQSLKTGKCDLFPLHPIAATYLKRIWDPWTSGRKKVFQGFTRDGGLLYQEWGNIIRQAGVERFSFHDIRRTAASEIERVSPGVGPTFLQHVPEGVSEVFYLNRNEELREAILKMRVPQAFNSK